MGTIRILPDHVVSKIAAGEIVERPASVVKELLENSLDASATSIKISLISGGKKSITVEDNGIGMSKDDALLSLERHATSKIKEAYDIENIATLGFRGEALPSISSVSRFQMTTKTAEDIAGVKVYIEGGILRKVEETGCPAGTLIEVKNLFYNIPPRLKFLKKSETELSNVLNTVQRHAISSFRVSIEVVHNGRTIMMMSARESMLSRLKEIFNSVDLHYFGCEEDGVKIYGYLTGPEDSRSSTYKIYSYVNKRPVKDRLIIRNIISAYGRILDKGRYPQGVINIDTSLGDVDVNVHPTKNEVRFRNDFKISNLIQKSIINMLENGPWIKTAGGAVKSGLYKPFSDRPSININSESGRYPQGEDFKHNTSLLADLKIGFPSDSILNKFPDSDIKFNDTPNNDMFGQKGLFGQLEVVGQVGDSYIVCQSERGLTLIDQHAAHERVNYEKFKNQFDSNKLEIQKFLIPLTFDVSVHETAVIEDNFEVFVNFGFELEKFGTNSFLLRSAPALLKNADFNTIITDVVGEISILNKQESLENIFHHLIATIACHNSVTANERMDNHKIKYLLGELDKTDLPFFCPHGRPVYKEFTFQELERFFKRT